MIANLNKWFQTMQISWTTLMAYRLNFALLVLGPALVFYFVKVSLWQTLYIDDTTVLQGFNLKEMLHYQSWSLVIVLLAQSSNGVNLSEDIRLGRISKYMVYPFNFWEFHTASFLSFQSLQFFIAGICLALLLFLDVLIIENLNYFFIGVLYSLLVGLFWFSVQYFTGLMAFWLDETWTMRAVFQIIVNFLSGAVIPLPFFPEWAQKVLVYTPFPSLTYTPIRIFMGDLSGLYQGLLTLFISMLFMIVINTLVWKKGVRLFSAAGM
ncbi:MAG: hypothetical protein CME71_03400 [Halobacteriovorax sp.]|nr:hypothetical protein [Halobacteriovorax sp.]|tara:strand:+ start:728 stop:1525 length:798 start_codon:yes stop_codon:yes gene_type:complete